MTDPETEFVRRLAAAYRAVHPVDRPLGFGKVVAAAEAVPDPTDWSPTPALEDLL